MPVKPKLINGKWRVVEAATDRIAKNKGGTALDGKGHSTKAEAQAQANAVNRNLS